MEKLNPWIGRAPITRPPEITGYRLVRGEELDLVRASLLGLLLVPVWWILFVVLVPLINGVDQVTVTLSILNILVAILFVPIFIVIHEGLHGIAILATGHLPSFGAGPGFFYTTCHDPLTRNAYLMVVVLPVLVVNLGAVAIAGIWPGAMGWSLFISVFSTMGAGGDIWMFLRLIRIPRSSLLVDMASGYAIYEPVQATTASPVEP